MSGWLGALEIAALVGAGTALVSVAGCALLYPLLRAPVRTLGPRMRARLLAAVAAVPLALPALVVFLCLLPSLLGALGLHSDHCPYHAEYLHLCVTHRPPPLPLPWSAVSVLGLVPLAGALAVGAGTAPRSRRLQRSLEFGSSGALRSDVRLVASRLPICVTAGVLGPRIFVSDGLAAALSAEEIDVVIEHERAHARRRDGLRKFAAAAASWMHLPALRRSLLRDLSLACEQACDDDAAQKLGDRIRVAETILAAERLLVRGKPGRAVCAFAGSAVPERVAHLLHGEPARSPSRAAAWAALGLAATAACALADPLHHLAEYVLARLMR